MSEMPSATRNYSESETADESDEDMPETFSTTRSQPNSETSAGSDGETTEDHDGIDRSEIDFRRKAQSSHMQQTERGAEDLSAENLGRLEAAADARQRSHSRLFNSTRATHSRRGRPTNPRIPSILEEETKDKDDQAQQGEPQHMRTRNVANNGNNDERLGGRNQREDSLKIHISLDLEVEVDLYARVRGDVTLGLM